MYDKTVTVLNSQIQHGKLSNRIYVMHIDKNNISETLKKLNLLATENNYTKIFAKVPESIKEAFKKENFLVEAQIPDFFNGNEKCLFMAKFFHNDRAKPVDKNLNNKVLNTALDNKIKSLNKNVPLQNGYEIKKATPDDAKEMALIYSLVFETYPVAVFDANYIKKSMKENYIYFIVKKGNTIVGVSSCDVCKAEKNAEMTDFAVLPQHRENNLSFFLLKEMEKEMCSLGIKSLYTIARATSFSMNSTFSKSNYSFGGTLVKSTQIGGDIEDMNVWFKNLTPTEKHHG